MRGLILAAAAAALGACYAAGDVGYTTPQATVYASASTPDLVTVSPGVQVVADYDEPVFYTDGFFWRYYNGYWYRSSDYATGWFYVSSPPIVITRIDRPYNYVHYRPRGYVVRNSVRHRRPEPIVVRDHRTYQPAVRTAPVRTYQAPEPRPVVRDHRAPAPAPAARSAPPQAQAPAPAPAPVVRDHREPSKETRDHRKH